MTTSSEVLESQVKDARRSIASDGYAMSIGELTTLYREGELIINPEFQRLFRWSLIQKSRLIESILLGIPLPSIFVAQREDGKWELVDGLQRISTVLQVQNELKDVSGDPYEKLVLEGTKFLPALEGREWDGVKPENTIPSSLKLDIKRAKIDVKILKRESSKETKFDLFQRLNSFGSTLTAQEVRSALLVGASPDFFAWLQGLAEYKSFKDTVYLSESMVDTQYDLELVLRFIVLHQRPEEKLSVSSLRDFAKVLDDESIEMAKGRKEDWEEIGANFKSTFDFIAGNGGSSLFCRWDREKKEFRGPFLNTAFEVFALGVGYYVAKKAPFQADLLGVAKKFWSRTEMTRGFSTGKSTETRLSHFVPLGRKLLAKS